MIMIKHKFYKKGKIVLLKIKNWYHLTKTGSLQKVWGQEKKAKPWVSKPSGQSQVRLSPSFLPLTAITRTAIDSHSFASVSLRKAKGTPASHHQCSLRLFYLFIITYWSSCPLM